MKKIIFIVVGFSQIFFNLDIRCIEISLKEAVLNSFKKEPIVKQYYKTCVDKKVLANFKLLGFLPSISTSLSPALDPFFQENNKGEGNIFSLNLSVNQNIISPDLAYYFTDSRKIDLEAAQSKIEIRKYEILRDIVSGYLQYSISQKLSETIKDLTYYYQELMKYKINLISNGNALDTDLLDYQLKLNDIEANNIRAKISRNSSLNKLLKYHALEEADIPEILDLNKIIDLLSSDNLEISIFNSPYYREKEIEYKVISTNYKRELLKFIPTVSVGGGVNFDCNPAGFVYNGFNLSLAVNFNAFSNSLYSGASMSVSKDWEKSSSLNNIKANSDLTPLGIENFIQNLDEKYEKRLEIENYMINEKFNMKELQEKMALYISLVSTQSNRQVLCEKLYKNVYDKYLIGEKNIYETYEYKISSLQSEYQLLEIIREMVDIYSDLILYSEKNIDSFD